MLLSINYDFIDWRVWLDADDMLYTYIFSKAGNKHFNFNNRCFAPVDHFADCENFMSNKIRLFSCIPFYIHIHFVLTDRLKYA